MFHFRKAHLLPLTGNECYRALKSSMSYVVFNIRAPFSFSLIYMRSILKFLSSKSNCSKPLHSQHRRVYETLSPMLPFRPSKQPRVSVLLPLSLRETEAQRGNRRCQGPLSRKHQSQVKARSFVLFLSDCVFV